MRRLCFSRLGALSAHRAEGNAAVAQVAPMRARPTIEFARVGLGTIRVVSAMENCSLRHHIFLNNFFTTTGSRKPPTRIG